MTPEQLFILTVTIPVDEFLHTVMHLLKFSSYEKTYIPSFEGVHLMVYKFGPLTELGFENWKTAFKEIYANSTMKKYCAFEVAEINQ